MVRTVRLTLFDWNVLVGLPEETVMHDKYLNYKTCVCVQRASGSGCVCYHVEVKQFLSFVSDGINLSEICVMDACASVGPHSVLLEWKEFRNQALSGSSPEWSFQQRHFYKPSAFFSPVVPFSPSPKLLLC